MNTKLTPRNAITAALFLGDNETLRYAPTGLSNASADLAGLIAAAEAQGCEFDA
jgi:hypothetical protein